jgi:hypothetical protein
MDVVYSAPGLGRVKALKVFVNAETGAVDPDVTCYMKVTAIEIVPESGPVTVDGERLPFGRLSTLCRFMDAVVPIERVAAAHRTPAASNPLGGRARERA